MKMNGKYELFAQIARRGLRLTALLAVVLGLAHPSCAQSSSTPTPRWTQDAKLASASMPAAEKSAVAAQVVATDAKSLVSDKEKAPAKGPQEGIKVHGHWTIVVKNADGTIAARQEFDNALDPIEGADLLTGLISGQYATFGFMIDLSASSGKVCGGGDCLLLDSRNPGLTQDPLVCPSFNKSNVVCSSLTYSPTTHTLPASATANANGYTLSGSVNLAATDGGTITTVGTGVIGCLALSNSVLYSATTAATYVSSAATTLGFIASPPGAPDTAAKTNGFNPSCQLQVPVSGNPNSTSGNYGALLLTSHAISQPVAGGQSVSVTVAITFSGS